MVFLPAIPLGGYSGWLILERSEENQRATFDQSPVLTSDIEYFKENIENALTAEDLVNDYRLLTVALGAYGLSEEINSKALIQQVLEGGTEDEESLANTLADPRFEALADAFGYGNVSGNYFIYLSSFADEVTERYKDQEFERAVGEVDNDMRLGLNFRREISEVADPEGDETTVWFEILGHEPLREVLEAAFNIPDSVSLIDIDRQQEIFAEHAKRFLGDSSPAIFQDEEAVDTVLRRFFLKRQLDNGPSPFTPGYAAMTMLQQGSLTGDAAQNLVLSQT